MKILEKREKIGHAGPETYTLPMLGRPSWEKQDTATYPFMMVRGEYSRQAFEHHALRVALRGDYAAPLERPGRILDVGSGPGYWAHEMCAIFPQAYVVGLDIDPTQRPGEKPPNYHFIRASLLDPLPFADNTFDYVHARLVMSSLPAKQVPAIMAELVWVTAPGGWLEIADIAPGFETMGFATAKFVEQFHEAHYHAGIDVRIFIGLDSILASYGMLNIVQRTLWLPLGARYGGRVGKLLEHDFREVYSSLKNHVLNYLPLSPAEYEQGQQRMLEEWNQLPTRFPFLIAYGQKSVRGLRARPYLLSTKSERHETDQSPGRFSIQ
jgi:SAM-dependent methyltransferase